MAIHATTWSPFQTMILYDVFLVINYYAVVAMWVNMLMKVHYCESPEVICSQKTPSWYFALEAQLHRLFVWTVFDINTHTNHSTYNYLMKFVYFRRYHCTTVCLWFSCYNGMPWKSLKTSRTCTMSLNKLEYTNYLNFSFKRSSYIVIKL